MRDGWIAFDEEALASRLDARESRGALAGALADLAARDRDAVALVAIAELSYEEAALALGISSGTLASQKEEAEAEMLSLIEDLFGEWAADKEATTRSASRSAPGDS